tara:strand:+ start:541 stop:750 length:210 start_codon:yes stop_codon:yes gene_type:complete
MSRLNKKVTLPIVEQENFLLDNEQKIEEYTPQHPAIAFVSQLSVASQKQDHLDNYVEVKPFEDKSPCCE